VAVPCPGDAIRPGEPNLAVRLQGGMEGGGRQFLHLGAELAARVQVGCVTDS